ncbi:MAG: insulinase family protein [Bacteroidetes bacterium]|nr:insulinase family protein [Bacteroidota bacterium]
MDKVINRKKQPAVLSIKSIDLTNPTIINLDNGIPVYFLKDGTQDLLKIEVAFGAGLANQPKRLVSSFTNKMLSEGTNSYSAFEIAEKLDSFGAYLATTIDNDCASITLYCLIKHLDNLLPIFEEIIKAPVFPQNELHILLNKAKQDFIINQQKVKYRASVNFPRLLFGEQHPYGQMAILTDFDELTQLDLENYYRSRYHAKYSKIFVSGKIPSDLDKKLNKYLGSSFSKEKQSDFQPDFNLQKTKYKNLHITVNEALQSAIWIGRKLFNKLHPDFIGMQLLNTILGGYFGSRLMTSIREDKGYTYGITSSVVSLKMDGYFYISTEVGTEYSELTITEVHREIDKLRTDLIPTQEIELVKNFFLGQLIRDLDGPFAVHDKLKAVVLYDLDLKYYQHLIDRIMIITPEELIMLANKYLSKDSLVELVVGK